MFYLRLFKTNYSKYMHTIVYALIGAIVPLLIIGTIVFSAIKIQNTDKSLIKGKVAVVTEDIKDQYTDIALNYLESMASTSSSMEFVIMDKDGCHRGKRVTAGDVYVDGSRIGDIGSIVIKDRKLMSKDGVLVTILNIDPSKHQLLIKNSKIDSLSWW